MKNEYTGSEKISKNEKSPSSRFMGTTSLSNIYKKQTPGQTLKTIKKTINQSFHLIGK